METLVAPSINLLILVSALVYYLRAPLKAFVAQRHVLIREDLHRVRALLRQAHEQYEEFSSKLKAVDAETSSLREQALRDAQAAKLRIVSAAQKASAEIVSDARASSKNMYEDLKRKISAEVGTAVLDRAEALMRDRLTGDDRLRMREEFSRQVESSQ